jgi:hypothetical protein
VEILKLTELSDKHFNFMKALGYNRILKSLTIKSNTGKDPKSTLVNEPIFAGL